MAYGGPYIPNAGAERADAQGAYEMQQAQRAQIAASMRDPNAGRPTSFWGRIAKDGAAKTQALLRMGKDMAVSSAKGIVGTGMDVSNTIGNAEIKAAKGIERVTGAKSLGFGKTVYKGAQTNQQQFGKKLTKFGGEDTAKQFAGNVIETASLVPGGAEAKGAEILLKQLGEAGVKELAGKVGIDATKSSIQDVAKQVAKSKVGKQAVREITQQGAKQAFKRAGKVTAEGAVRGAGFGGGGAAANNESGKQIAKSTAEGAAFGAALGGGGSLFKSAFDKVMSRYRPDTGAKDLQTKETNRQAANKFANERGLPQGKTTKQLPQGKTTSALPQGSRVRGLPEGRSTSEAKPLEGKKTFSSKSTNNDKVAQLELNHQQNLHNLHTEFKQVMKGVQKSDHVVTKQAVDGYTSTRALQQDYADMLKQQEDTVRGGVIAKGEEGGKVRTSEHSQFYRSTFAEKGRAPTKAEYMDQALKDMKSGKAGFGISDTYQKLKDQAVHETDQKYTGKLEDMESSHAAKVKEAQQPTEKGFTVSKEEPKKVLSPKQKQAQTRINQIDAIIENAQRNGTQKSASELRGLMRERSDLQKTVNSGEVKVTPGKKVTVDTLKEAAAKSSAKETPKVASESPKPTEAKPSEIKQETKSAAEQLGAKTPKPEKVGMGEGGAVNPGQFSKDMKEAKSKIDAHIARSKKAATFSGDIAKDAHIHEGMNKQRMVDSAKLLKSLANVSKEDKKAVWQYREALRAGTPLPKLTKSQQELHQIVTDLTKASNENKQQLVDMKAPGYSQDKIFDPEAGNHRIALGKGSAIERFMGKRQKTVLSARSLRTSTSSSKARVYYSVTDANGSRSVAAIKNVSVQKGLRKVARGKFVNIINEDGSRIRLGKITPSELKAGEFTGKDGKVYKIGQATSDEIGKVTGQKYLEDPLTSAIIDYHETANAVEAAKMIDKWKKSPEFEDIAMKHGEGTPPKGWKTTKLPQMQGYTFDPKVANVLDDIYGNIRDKAQSVSLINHALRNMMVAIPIRHNFNEIGFYFTDRGLSSLINPLAYKRGSAALVKAVNEVMNQGPLYREVVSKGFNFMYQDDKAFADAVTQQTKSMLFDDQQTAERVASDLGTSVVKLRQAWNTIQHKGVWFQQDVLNMARIIERMDKNPKMTVDEAAARTARFNPQYRVPSHVAGSRTASQILRNNNLLFFGSYHYDQWKTLANMVGDLAGKNGGKAALESADKFGALALGVWATHALVDKGLQNLSGNKNAYTKPFGVLDLPDQLYQLATGQKDIGAVMQSQVFPSAGLNTIAQVFENRDFYTGAKIRDTNMPKSVQVKQLATWLNSQMPWGQQISSNTKGGNATSDVLSAAIGARYPKNSPATNNLESLKYDSLPNVQTQAYKQAQAGNVSGAKQTISQYDSLVLAAAKNALKSEGKPVPPDDVLIKQLKKNQYYYAPKDSTIQKWSTQRPKSILEKL